MSALAWRMCRTWSLDTLVNRRRCFEFIIEMASSCAAA